MSEYKIHNRFLDPERVLFRSGLISGQVVADLGAGSGFYALASAKIVGNKGKVYVVDIVESALAHVEADARLRMVKNIVTIRADLEQSSGITRIPDGSCDLVVYGCLLHQLKDKKHLFSETYRILKTKGKLLVVDWNDRPGHIGPAAEQRLTQEQVNKLVSESGLKFTSEVETDPYHYGLIFIK